MASTCAVCGTNLPFLRRLTGQPLCSACETQRRESQHLAERQYKDILDGLIQVREKPSEARTKLLALAYDANLGDDKRRSLNVAAFRGYLTRALADDYLSSDEEQWMNELAGALDIDQRAFEAEFSDLKPQLIVARVNDGRLPLLSSSRILLKRNELAHLETDAALLKEVVIRETQGRSSGVSFRIMKGVYYHVGQSRGRSVVVGSRLETTDTGVLTVTSQRAVYSGTRQSIEMPYTKLLGLNTYEDGIQFHLSNRKNPPLFKLESGLGHVVAAVVNAASQQQV